jgi:glyoxylase-like metal-dependent hydrolase (beta-lactamase superfamily II)
MSTDCISVAEYPHGILCIDSGFMRDRMAACYLLESNGELAIIETGTQVSVGRMLNVLKHRGWQASQVRYVIVTHVHLDHAGGAGGLMQACPEATFLVHPRGARHMADPSKLEASVRRVYGDEAFNRSYGTLVPIAPERTLEMADGDSIELGGRRLAFADTPGHARHHFCVWDETSRGWFAGDTFGLSYRELDTDRGSFIFPTTTPIEFDPPVLKQSMDRLVALDPQWMYLTHYGRVGEVRKLADQLKAGIDAIVEIAERHSKEEDRVSLISADYSAWLVSAVREHGVDMPDAELMELLQPDIDLNTQGVDVWLHRREKQERANRPHRG